MSEAAESLFATLFPSDCRICYAPLLKISRLPVCDSCLSRIAPIAGILCCVCGERLPGISAVEDVSDNRCAACVSAEPSFYKAAAYGSYSGGLRDLIHLLKYDHVRPAANVLGRMLSEVIDGLAEGFNASPLIMVPVPLHSRKLRERGFNHSELIARAALKLKPAQVELALKPEILLRRRATESQTGLSRDQRQRNVRGAFAVTRQEDVRDREILLVDDVLTTGTTVSECARVLRRAGATRVWVATVARTLKSEAVWATREFTEEDEALASKAAHA
jgi:ComF family protein